jgi:hypothetical protein
VRLHGLQSCIAQRHCWRLLVPSRSALLTRGRRGLRRRACSAPLPGCAGFSPKSFHNTFGDLQLIELTTELFSFGVEALDPFGNALFLLAHQPRHLLISPLCQVGRIRNAPIFPTSKQLVYRKRPEAHKLPLGRIFDVDTADLPKRVSMVKRAPVFCPLFLRHRTGTRD